jgi:O-succinylbenzoate synthase
MDSIIKNEIDLLYEINSKYPDIFFRLDFNETFSYNSFLDFWNLLSSQIKSRIEYCEDPIPWSVENWLNLHNLGVPLAADRVLDDLMLEVFGDLNKFSLIKVEKEKIFAFIKVFVLKPAKYNLDLLFNLKEQEISELVKNNIKFVVTSYLDHPVGVAHAFVEALKLKKMYSDLLITCGLNSAGAYEKINFNLEENIIKSLNDSTREFGIGFSNLLENQKWIYCGQF